MALNWPQETVGELLDYSINWAKALTTDTITASSWTISDPSLVEDHATFAPSATTIWLTGGTPNNTYTVTNTIMTAGGRTFVQAVLIKVVSAS